MSFILIMVLYSGPVFMADFNTNAECEAELVRMALYNGNMKKIKVLECIEND